MFGLFALPSPEQGETIRVLIADSQVLFAEALAMALECESDIAVVNVFPTSGLQTEEVVLIERPSVLLLDFWIRGMEAPVLTARIQNAAPSQKIILLSWFARRALIRRGLQAGAAAAVSKSASLEQVASIIRKVNRGERMVAASGNAGAADAGPTTARGDVRDPSPGVLFRLSPREIRVLELLSLGFTPKQIADHLSITLPTLRTHTNNILRKTGSHTLVEALGVAFQSGLLR